MQIVRRLYQDLEFEARGTQRRSASLKAAAGTVLALIKGAMASGMGAIGGAETGVMPRVVGLPLAARATWI